MSIDVDTLLIRMIKSIKMFEGITDEAALELAKDFHLGFYPVKSIIIKQGTKPDKIYILKNGKLEASRENGFQSTVLGHISPSEIFGEMSYFNNTEANANVFAVQDSDIWEIGVNSFSKFLDNHPDIKAQAQEVMTKRQEMNKGKIDSGDSFQL